MKTLLRLSRARLAKIHSHNMAAAFRNENSCLLVFYAVVRGLSFKRLSVPAK